MTGLEHSVCEILAECNEPREIVRAVYKLITPDEARYPEHLDIRMNDGRIIRYKKLREYGGA